MAYLNSHGYKPICFSDITTKSVLPEKPIIITFDDGYESVFQNAAPIMDKYGFKSVVFVVTEYFGKYNLWEAVPFQQKFRHLSIEQITKMRNQGHEIGSHSKMHKYLPILNSSALKEEIEDSKAYLESMLDDKITSFCYPYGRYNDKIKSMVKNAGYKYATSNAKINNYENDPLSLKRRSIYSTDSIKNFKTKITSQSTMNITYLTEILIQKGALASIGINFLRPSKSHF
jgi:peptidoglycan/xylan/chitin deacetylase (PgdA/CDA1 family)